MRLQLEKELRLWKHNFPELKGKLVADTDLTTNDTQKEPFEEDENKQFCTVYTKFFRNEDGEVCFVKSTETVIVEKETFLNPDYKGSVKEEPNSTSLSRWKRKKSISRCRLYTLSFC